MKRRPRRRAAASPLPQLPSVLHVLDTTILVLLPLTLHLPWWITTVVAVIIAWRVTAALRGWPQPGPWLRAIMTIAGVVSVYLWFGRINGLVAGAALLTVATALKLTELRDRRDLRILVALLYFTLLVNFLFSQALWTILYLLVCCCLITAVLIESNHTATALPRRTTLRLAAVLTMQALPLMAVLFILFPRIPGPLWGLPADSGAEPAGLADSMSPGDIRKLVLSDDVAFRVHFDGPAPPPSERYWRGPVLTHYDGHRWTPGFIPQAPPHYVLEGPPVRYRITLEPSRSRWLFAMDIPDPSRRPEDSTFNGDAVLTAREDNRQRRSYTLVSYPRYTLTPQLGASERRADLALPEHIDPRARALARGWRRSGLSPTQIVAAALHMYRNQDFRYTLEPPPVGRNAVDDFLFQTRAGFCEHYAGSFTFLMRAAGIPARVVTGYQGGTKNPYGDYYVIRQNDAHAWSEVWIRGRGWLRVDPTAAVAPTRIQDGINTALAGTRGLPAFLSPQWHTSWRHLLQARWDWLNQQWNHFVLGYGPDLQAGFMAALGLAGWSAMILALTASIIVVLGVLALFLMIRTRRVPGPADTAQRLWRRATRRLQRYGLQQAPSEGPDDFAQRVCRQRPAVAPWMHTLHAAYIAARYVDPGNAQGLATLARAARAPLPD